MGKSKKLLLVSVALLLISMFSISYTIAYLTDTRTATNQLEFGHVKVQVIEKKWIASLEGKDKLVIVPGGSYAKDPAVKNIGTVPCIVRATITIGEMKDDTLPQHISDYIELLNQGKDWVVKPGDVWGGKKVTVYFLKIINPDDTTPLIFDGFKVKKSVNGVPLLELEGKVTDFGIAVNVQAIQAEGIDALNGKSKFTVEDMVNAFGEVEAQHEITPTP